MPRLVVALIALLAPLAPAAGEDLETFLTAATVAARPEAVVRADGELVIISPDGSARDQIALLRRPNGDLYIELRTSGARALISGDGKTALLVPAKGKSAQTFALDGSLAGSEFTREDFQPFTSSAYRSPSIADRNGGELTVSLTPNQGQYALKVITFDSEKKAPLVTKDYKDTVSNLVKMQRDRGLVSVGGRWLPTEVSMENFPMRATSTLTLHWQATDDVPALFDPATLSSPSSLKWPGS